MKLTDQEVSFLKQATESVQIAGKDAPFVAQILTKLIKELEVRVSKQQTKGEINA